MKTKILIPAIIGITVSLVALASFVFIGNLVNVTFTVNPSYAQFNLITINLGNLTTSQYGYATSTITINIEKSGDYQFVLENQQILQQEFSNFTIVLSVVNSTAYSRVIIGGSNITGWIANDTLYFNTGTYTVSVAIYYTVSSNAQPLTFDGNIVGLRYVS
ncbi:hypothetical protein SJAV_03050 [Sulfurisphaera javensis]|uniref:Sulfocyanin n=1 Tax=Sulfurisphaera javensis TaxID=2049879 RepID=A0AAT9GNG2_9CREN